MLELEDLCFAYPQTQTEAGYRFSLSAASGAITSIEGRSGAGKSTLLDLIAGFLRPASGRVMVDGKDITPLEPEQRPISILFQSEILFEHLSAASNVALGLKAPAAEHVASALAEVGLKGIARQRASTLSGGQKQRVALARTLLRNRPVLLLDEPFSALDDETRASVRALVKSLTVTHRWTTILVTHHADDIAAIADKRYRLENGVLVAA